MHRIRVWEAKRLSGAIFIIMDTALNEKKQLGKVFAKYLFPCIGSALIVSVYSLVDCIMVGHYAGPDGTAALAIVMPIWTIIISLGLLFGVGGGVLMSKARGENDKRKGDEIFTVTLIGAAVVSVAAWVVIAFFNEPLLRLFGADDKLLPLAQQYLKWLRYVVPFFTFGQVLSSFLRNDNAPGKAMVAIVTGGLFNIVGDYLLVFTADLGIEGAGLATGIGQLLAFSILCTHFFSKKNTLRLAKPKNFFKSLGKIAVTGFPSFIVDIAMGVTAMFVNNQIMRYSDSDSLAVYGVIVNISFVVQYVAYGIGQAAQPLISRDYGAKNWRRIKIISSYGWIAAAVWGLLGLAFSEAFPMLIVKAFMPLTDSIAAIAPSLLRQYSIAFALLPLNVYATYYLQAIMRPNASILVSFLRGIGFTTAFIYLLPYAFGSTGIWYAVFASEALTLICAVPMLLRYNKKLPLLLSRDISPAAEPETETDNAPDDCETPQ